MSFGPLRIGKNSDCKFKFSWRLDQRIIAAAVALNSVQFGKTRTFKIRVKFGSNLNSLKYLNKFKIMLSEYFFDELLVILAFGFERDRDISVTVLQAGGEAVVVDFYDVGICDL